MFFQKESVYMGYSLKTFSKIKNALGEQNLKYFCKLDSASYESAATGSLRRNAIGENPEYEQRYEIFVKKADLEKANYIIHQVLK